MAWAKEMIGEKSRFSQDDQFYSNQPASDGDRKRDGSDACREQDSESSYFTAEGSSEDDENRSTRRGVRVLVGKKRSKRRPLTTHFSEPRRSRVQEPALRREKSRSTREAGAPVLSDGEMPGSPGQPHRPKLDPYTEKLYAFSILQQQAKFEMQKITEERLRRYSELHRAKMAQLPAARRKTIAFRRPEEKEALARRRRHKPMKLERARLSEADIEIRKTRKGNKIESFADFSDSLFNYRIVDGAKFYICPHPGCKTELPGSISRIKRHYIIHTKIRPFECLNVNCDKKFSRKDNMLQHFRIHCEHKNIG
jgi:hypothetical protein